MNYRYVINQTGTLLVLFSAALAVLAVIAWLLDAIEGVRVDLSAEQALTVACAACLLVGGGAWWFTRRCSHRLGRREAMLLVTLSWLLGALFAALPYLLWAHMPGGPDAGHPFRSFVNCYFEAMSGLTTTGATILTDIEAIPRELLMWRAFTHWIGGIGVVVLFVAVFPSLGVGGKKLFKVETPGPAPTGLRPRVRDTARTLAYIYLGLTLLEIAALWIGTGMHLFDAVCHSFATVATGGFSTQNASMGAYYDKPAADVIVIFFMVLAGANFGLYYQLWRSGVRATLKDTELRVYLGMLVIGSLLIAASILAAGDPLVLTTGATIDASAVESLRQGTLTAVSVQTTTGFCTTDFDRWPFLAHAVLIAFMFVGGCAGSTAGGLKVIRVWLALKMCVAELEKYFRPQVTRPIRVAGSSVDREIQLTAVIYVLSMLALFVLGWVAIMLLEQTNAASVCTSTTAATASVASLCTIGPGLEGVGATANYGWFSASSKLVMCVLMAVGRLEVYAVMVLLLPGFWRTPGS